jgi:hypothetical protein
MAVRAHFSHKELYGKSSRDMIGMQAAKGLDFFALPARFRRGAYVQRRLIVKELPPETLARIPLASRPSSPVMRRETMVLDMTPLRRVENFVDVLLRGDEPVIKKRHRIG